MKRVTIAIVVSLFLVRPTIADEQVGERIVKAFYKVYPCGEPAEAIKIAKTQPKALISLLNSNKAERDRYAAFHVYVSGKLPNFKSVVTTGLSDRSEQIRSMAAHQLPNAVPKEQLPKRYLALLSDKSSMIRYTAAELLAKYPNRDVFDPLAKLLSDPDLEVRHRAAITLSELQGGRPILRKLTSAGDSTVAGVAATTLAWYPDEPIELSVIRDYLRQQLPLLTGPPYNGVDIITYGIVEQLGKRGDSKSIDVLELAVTHKHQSVSQAATKAISKIEARESQRRDRTTR